VIALDATWTAFHGLPGGLVVAWLLETSPPTSWAAAGAPVRPATTWDDVVDLSAPVGGVLPGAGGPEPLYEAWIRLRDEKVAAQLGVRGSAAVLLDAMPLGLFGLWTDVRPVPGGGSPRRPASTAWCCRRAASQLVGRVMR
jgi:hypothetical protein